MSDRVHVSSVFDPTADFVLWEGDCRDLLAAIPDEFIQPVVTSPPYNLGKPYKIGAHPFQPVLAFGAVSSINGFSEGVRY